MGSLAEKMEIFLSNTIHDLELEIRCGNPQAADSLMIARSEAYELCLRKLREFQGLEHDELVKSIMDKAEEDARHY